MADEWDPAAARRKLRAPQDALVCDPLLVQDVFAGVGDIIKNERCASSATRRPRTTTGARKSWPTYGSRPPHAANLERGRNSWSASRCWARSALRAGASGRPRGLRGAPAGPHSSAITSALQS